MDKSHTRVQYHSMKTPATILLLLLFCALLFTAWKSWEQAAAYDRETRELISWLDTDGRLEMAKAELLETITFGLYHGHTEELQKIQQQRELQRSYQQSAWLLTAIFFALIFPTLACAYLIRKNWLDTAYTMLGVGLVCLVAGLVIPILSISLSKELPLLGDTVLQFQSKGILSTISGLMDSGNLWLAGLLFLFSVLIPFTKTLLVGITLFARTHHFSLQGLHLSHGIGKWSMADVFVVALLVVFFSSGGEGLTNAEVQVGLCFFAGYVVLSLLGTQIVTRGLGAERGP